jgi:hypothetical protein
MVAGVSDEMNQVLAGEHSAPSNCFRKFRHELLGRQPAYTDPDCLARRLDLPEQLGAWHTAAGKLGGPVPHIPGFPKDGSQEVLQIAGEVEHQGAGGVGYTRHGGPQLGLVREGIHLAAERREIPVQD